ncbi:MAG: hypothetical protein EPO21_12955 [Chloroflexota bacterium]|nr:MAG: hypothetical protein EPO21_12955 [Chloroflexota bacterium]
MDVFERWVAGNPEMLESAAWALARDAGCDLLPDPDAPETDHFRECSLLFDDESFGRLRVQELPNQQCLLTVWRAPNMAADSQELFNTFCSALATKLLRLGFAKDPSAQPKEPIGFHPQRLKLNKG